MGVVATLPELSEWALLFFFACNISLQHKIQWTLFNAMISEQAMGGVMHCRPREGTKCDCSWRTDLKQD